MKGRVAKIQSAAKANSSQIVLMIATFFNPFGYDALFALIMRWTNSFWVTDLIFYCLSALFFGLYFFLRRKKKSNENLNI